MFPVKAAAELSGLKPETLRAWERRHRAVVPHRDDSGRRLYDATMVERLARLYRLTERGHPIRDLAKLDDDALEQLLERGRRTGYGGVSDLPGRMMAAIADYRIDAFDRDLQVAIATMPITVLVARVVAPLLREIGARWADGRLAVAQERMVSSLLRSRLMSVLGQHPRERPPRILFATLPGEPHELGLLGAALHAHDAGAPVLYLGTGLPPEELARVASRLEVAGVGISSIDPDQAPAALGHLERLHQALPDAVRVWVGGANAPYLAETLRIARISPVTDPAALARLVRRLPAGGRR